MDKVIFTVCKESKKYDKNNSDSLGRAIHLKHRNLSYPKSWLVVMDALCVFVCLCGSCRFLVLLEGFWLLLRCSWWFMVVLGDSWLFLVVLGASRWLLGFLVGSWWFLAVLGGFW